MLYVGLTGNIASGKTEVTHMLADHGATVVDADELARDAVVPGTAAFRQIVARWGPGMVGSDGTLDRGALRRIAFADRGELDALNAIMHPQVAALRDAQVDAARRREDAVVVYAVPLLFERNLASEFDKIILVDAPPGVRLHRIVQQRGLPVAEAMNMISSQMPAELKRGRADIVIENTGSIDELRRRVDAVWEQLTAQDGHPSLAV